MLRFRQDRNQSPGNPPQKSEHWNLVQSSSSPSRENLAVGHLPSIMQYCAGGGIIVREHLNFSYQLDVVDFLLTLGAVASQLFLDL